MKYEICIQTIRDGVKINTTIAWTDVITYAKQIVQSLNITGDALYVLLSDGKEISSL